MSNIHWRHHYILVILMASGAHKLKRKTLHYRIKSKPLLS